MAWDGAQAEREIRKYAGDADGKPIPSKAKQCYLKVVGDGTKWGDYSYPYVRIKDGKPVPDFDGLKAAWVYARQHDPQLLRKIISICKREGFELTPSMEEWAKQHQMSALAVELMPDAGVIEESGDEIIVRGIVMREGVYNGALQEYTDFVLDAPALVGTPVIRGEHPRDENGEPVSVDRDSPNVIGRIADVELRPDIRAIMAVFSLSKSRLTPDELEKIRRGEPIATSLGYWCNTIELAQHWKYNGSLEFNRIERGPREFDHVATPMRPACKDCGILFLNSEGGAMTEKEAQAHIEAPQKSDCSMTVKESQEVDMTQTTQTDDLKAALEAVTAQLRTLSEDLAALKAAEAARMEAEKAAADEARKAEEQNLKSMFMSWLKPGKEAEAEQLWEKARENPWRFRIENPGLFVAMSEDVKYAPQGASKVPLSLTVQSEQRVQREDGLVVMAATNEVDWESMGIKSPAQLAKELGYTV